MTVANDATKAGGDIATAPTRVTDKACRDRHIDGLRAVALAMVIAAHCGVRGASGGYAGVDVFYVISGFLITRLLLGEQARTGRVDLAAFFARRARRLVPALVIMLLGVLAAGVVLLLPDEQNDLARTTFPSLAFAANFQFAAVAQNYFAPRSVLSPLQHLWTLGVEGQFYLIWPLVIIALGKFAGRWRRGQVDAVAVVVAMLSAASLGLSIVLTVRDPVGSFYLPHTRAWELGCGALLCWIPPLRHGTARVMLPAGLVALALTTMLLRNVASYPSYLAVLPVVGAAMLIMAGARAPDALVARALASAPMVYLGRRSYGFYLWHWPLLAFARINRVGEIGAIDKAVLMVAALLLAMASWRLVEAPIIARRGVARMNNPATIIVAAVALIACVLPALALLGWSARALPAGSIIAQYRAGRMTQARDFPFCPDGRQDAGCVLGTRDANRALLLYGDSHAAQLSAGLDLAARVAGVRIIARTLPSCAPTGFDRLQPATEAVRDACDRFNARVLAELPALRSQAGIVGVIVAGNWGNAASGWGARLDHAVVTMHRAGLRVVLARDTPAQAGNFIRAALLWPTSATGAPLSRVNRQQHAETAMLAMIARQPDTRLWSPLPSLCIDGLCRAVADGKLLYRNPTHLTLFATRLLGPSLVAPLRWAAP